MPVTGSTVTWAGALWWLVAIAVAAFAVSWLATRLRVRRAWYIAVLSIVTAALSVGYLTWSGSDAREVLMHSWGWGLLAAPLAAAFAAVGVTRLPASQPRAGRDLGEAVVWEGVVYGAAEGVLLSALPALVAWQAVDSLESNGWLVHLASWLVPLAASVVVIVVHHLGYPEFRGALMGGAVAGCGLLTLGYLLTGSVLTPVVGHMIMHISAIRHGAELPPMRHPVPGAPGRHAAARHAVR